jgi:hypothetical protein
MSPVDKTGYIMIQKTIWNTLQKIELQPDPHKFNYGLNLPFSGRVYIL